MRVVLCGQRAFGAGALKAIVDQGHDVALVVSPGGVGADGRPADRLTDESHKRGLPWTTGDNTLALQLEAMVPKADVVVAAHSHSFISKRVRGATELGGIGYHPSLLPRHRGRDAVRWTVHMGDPVAGGTVYWLSDAVDGGDIAVQDWCHVDPGWSASELWRERLFPMGADLLVRALDDLENGEIHAHPQDERFATWEPSWSRPPMVRPDLPQIGPAPNGYRVIKTGGNRCTSH